MSSAENWRKSRNYFCHSFYSTFQLYHDAIISRSTKLEVPSASLHSLLTKYLELFSSKPPKGFGKFYGEDNKPKNPSDPLKKPSDEKRPIDTESLDKEFKKFEKKIDRLFFKEKAKSSDGDSGKGRPIGGGDDKGTYYTAGFIAASAIVFGIMYYSYYAQTEISWKEFTGYGRDSFYITLSE